MDFDDAKENIQPLPAGRNASILQALMRIESPQELQEQRLAYEKAIHDYTGDDPLEAWYTYISWIEQSFPSGGKESGLDEVLTKCLARFESEERYYQDRRMIKLYIKFIDSHKNPTECYQQLYNAGIGTMVADLYMCWAYYYDLSGNTRKADEIFRRGLACRAQPLEELQEAHQHFGFTVAQRVIYKDDVEAKEDADRQMQERRFALTSLRGYRRKAAVGSIRTGGVVKSFKPGTVQSEAPSCSRRGNAQVPVFSDENANPNNPSNFMLQTIDDATVETGKSVVRSIIDAARHQENQKEPGPWHKAHDKKKSGRLFDASASNRDVGFSIMEDDAEVSQSQKISPKRRPLDPSIPVPPHQDYFAKPFIYPASFVAKNKPQSSWHTPVTIENEPNPRAFPEYNKCMLYPRPNMEFQYEEYRAYLHYVRRGISNVFTAAQAAVWSTHDINANVRQYPNFAKHTRPQVRESLDEFYAPPKVEILMAPNYERIYNVDEKEEYQLEELFAMRWMQTQRNETIMQPTDMEETVCVNSERMLRRKSFFPARKSMAAKLSTRTTIVPEREEEIAAKMPKVTEDLPVEVETAESPIASSVALPEKVKTPADSTVQSPESSTQLATTSSDPPQPLMHFEIFQDPTQTVPSDAAFEFKTPAMPTALKNNFEIYTEDATPAATTTSAYDVGDEETCSTQTFNIFLRKQAAAASTPKVIQKTASRQFGTVLKDLPTMPTHDEPLNMSPQQVEVISLQVPATATSDDRPGNNVAATTGAGTFSPQPLKQLSTILETSEHATTQSTHTTTASTKSTISSPDNEFDTVQRPHTVLEPLPEQSEESSKVEVLMDKMQLTEEKEIKDHTSNVSKSEIPLPPVPAPASVVGTPAVPRLQSNFSIYTEPTQDIKHVGDFSRLEEREDTAAGYAVRPVRFQEDKTETIPKLPMKFQEDKTETISKIIYPSLPTTFELDRTTGTIPKIPSTMPPPLDHMDDTFEFFSKTPPKDKMKLSFLLESHDKLLTPLLAAEAKRFCSQETPKKSINLVDSFLPLEDSCIVPETQPTTQKTTTTTTAVTGVNLGVSFLPDLSLIGETQSNNSKMLIHSTTTNKTNLLSQHFMKDFTMAQRETIAETKTNSSFLNRSSKLKFLNETQQQQQQQEQQQQKDKLLQQQQLQQFEQQERSIILQQQQQQKHEYEYELQQQEQSLLQQKEKLIIQQKQQQKEKSIITTKPANQTGFFELNAETEMFNTNNSMIKNSTWLPQNIKEKSIHVKLEPGFEMPQQQQHQQQQQLSIHNIKEESYLLLSPPLSSISSSSTSASRPPPSIATSKIPLPTPKLQFLLSDKRSSIALSQSELTALQQQQQQQEQQQEQERNITTTTTIANDGELSIYYTKTPRTPKQLEIHTWSDDSNDAGNAASLSTENLNRDNHYIHTTVDFDQTNRDIAHLCADTHVNPFNVELIAAFLDQIDFVNYIENLSTCQLVGRLQCLQAGHTVNVHRMQFKVLKLIAEGAYGVIYSAKESHTNKMYALKQERPSNYWEYYVCLEIQSRIKVEEILPAFMSVDYALIGNNASILVTPFAAYGSLISVCNKIKKSTNKNVDEYVVMHMTRELLEIIDHLHAISIIHADVKADNVVLLQKLAYNNEHRALQLIDFGVSIDMKLFKPNQTFTYVNHDNAFKCVEMHEQRPWTYQLDLYGLASIVHVLLYGNHMEIERHANGKWMPKMRMPRYFKKDLWANIFETLLNVPDCRTMPNLQKLRASIKEELVEKERYVLSKIDDFNRALLL